MTCRIFPILNEEALSELASPAEAKFYRACRDQLPDNVLVLHSLSIIDGSSPGRHHVGECDFVIVDPHSGVFVVEIKGGGIEFVPSSDPKWYSTNRHGEKFEIKDPFKQSESYRFRILSIIKNKARGLKNVHFPMGHSVAFPDIDSNKLSSITGHNRPREIIACSEDLQNLTSWYRKSLDFWFGKKSQGEALGKKGMSEIEKVFLKPVMARPSLSSQLDEQERTRIKLTDEQLRLGLFLQNHQRANITGGAGTGKTVVAKFLAENFAQQGLNTLLLCFNRGLGDELESDLTEVQNLTSGSFHSFFTRLLGAQFSRFEEKANASFPASDYWSVVLPFAYALALEEIKTRFDAVIIDEAQDLSAESWMPIEMLLAEDTSKFFLFSDTNQRLFSTKNDIPELSPPFLLYANCRNTKAIHATAYQDYEGPEILPPSIEGEPVLIISEGKLTEQLKIIEETTSELIQKQGILPENIAVLVADSITAEDKFNWLKRNTNKIKYVESEGVSSGSVRVSTVKKFKGLEASIVILWGSMEVSKYDRQEIHYVGVSRAKSICYLVN